MTMPQFHLFRFEPSTVKDAWGYDVAVEKLAEVVTVELASKRKYDNGYETVMIDVASDIDGRTFHRPIEVDYWTGAHWYEDYPPVDTNTLTRVFYKAKHLPFSRMVDAADNPVTKEIFAEAYKNE